jgi:hypothetical protein
MSGKRGKLAASHKNEGQVLQLSKKKQEQIAALGVGRGGRGGGCAELAAVGGHRSSALQSKRHFCFGDTLKAGIRPLGLSFRWVNLIVSR